MDLETFTAHVAHFRSRLTAAGARVRALEIADRWQEARIAREAAENAERELLRAEAEFRSAEAVAA